MRLSGTDLAAVRGGRPIFDGLSFTVAAGEYLAVTGPNGAGKSTLLRIVAGLLKPDHGAIAIEPEREDGLAGALHYLGHLDGLKRVLTVRENLAYWRDVWGGDGDIDDALDAVELEGRDHLPVATLSAGQRRRVALARLRVARRPIWLLDEPTTSLDVAGEAMLGRLISAHLAEGGIVVAATHRDLAVAPTTTFSFAVTR